MFQEAAKIILKTPPKAVKDEDYEAKLVCIESDILFLELNMLNIALINDNYFHFTGNRQNQQVRLPSSTDRTVLPLHDDRG